MSQQPPINQVSDAQIEELMQAVLLIQKRYGNELANVQTRRVSEIRDKINEISSQGA